MAFADAAAGKGTNVKTLILAGLPFIAWSPSCFELDLTASNPQTSRQVWLAYDGQNWRVAVDGAYGTRPFASRNQAVDLIAYEFARAQQGELI